MSTKTPNRNQTRMTQTSKTLASMSPVLRKTIWRWTTNCGIIHEGLGDHDVGLQLGVEDRSLRQIWKNGVGNYLRGTKGCGSSATEKREK